MISFYSLSMKSKMKIIFSLEIENKSGDNRTSPTQPY